MNPTLEIDLMSPGRLSQPGQPPWEVALLFPRQGEWSEADYLALDTKRLVELSDGCLEVLPMPTILHQLIVQFLFKLFDQFAGTRAAWTTLLAPLPVRLFPGKYREPDILLLSAERLRRSSRYPQGADLVIEVVSAGTESRERDLELKRGEYAQAGIAEYWIVDPELWQITVLTLDGQVYREHGRFGAGSQADSVLLAGFAVSVDAVFSAGQTSP